MNVNLIVAIDSECYGIGKNGSIPWKNKEDMKWFKEVTTGEGNNAVVMGRTTFESIGKPLSDRLNIILSNTVSEIDGCTVARSLEESIQIAKDNNIESLFIIGGGKVYNEALRKNIVDIVYIDKIVTDLKRNDFDTYFDYTYITDTYEYSDILTNIYTSNLNIEIYYNVKTITNNVDIQYLNLISKIINSGQTKHTRAGDTLSLFGETMRFDVRNGLPILTTKKVFSKGCIHELLWFLQGGTNIKYLVENNTHIWDDDAYRYFIQLFENDIKPENRTTKEEFIKKVLSQETRQQYTYGDLGPVYGKQWTDWNGINQVNELIEKLKTNPDDRRLMISVWNVGELKNMALPPCHYLSQWYVTEIPFDERVCEYNKRHPDNNRLINEVDLDNEGIPSKYLSVMWQQRSVDTCLGLPYDLLSYSIFLHLIAQCTNMIPYEVICCLGDTHIYKNQLQSAVKQLKRNPYKYNLPILKLNTDIKDIYEFTYDDIKIENYKSYPSIKYQLSVGL